MNRVQTVISEGEFRFTPETIHHIPFPESVSVFEWLGRVVGDSTVAHPFPPPATGLGI